MEERLITFETAKLAKEKGFNELCFNIWSKHGNSKKPSLNYVWYEEDELFKYEYYAPTQSLLQKWLREKHKLIVSVIPFKDHSADVNDDHMFQYRIHYKGVYGSNKSYEEALEEGLQEALKLIK